MQVSPLIGPVSMRFSASTILSALLFAPLLATPAAANDSIARVGTGGLVFLKTADIRMAREQLVITPTLIEVRYRFENDSSRPISATVAFPMPAYGWNPRFSAMDENRRPIESFTVTAAGKRLRPHLQRRALLGGREADTALRKAGLSRPQIFGIYDDPDPDFTPAQTARLASLGALSQGNPAWQVEETAYWQQTFPAHRPLEVTHRYKPFSGTLYAPLYPEDSDAGYPALPLSSVYGEEAVDSACVKGHAREAIITRVQALFASGAKGVMVYLHDVEYILGTARNWKGPISDFTLDLHADAPADVIAVCLPGEPTREQDGTLEYHFSDFTPPDRIRVNFYHLEAMQD